MFQVCVNDALSLVLSLQMVTAAAQQFWVDILPVDDGTPRIVTNLGLQWLEYVDGRVRPSVTLTALGCILFVTTWIELQFNSCLPLPQ